MLRTHRAGRGPGGGGMEGGLGSMQQEGPQPWRAEEQVQDPSRLTGPEWVGETLGTSSQSSDPTGPLPIGLSPPPPSFPPMPQDPQGWRGPWRMEDQAWEPSRLLRPQVGEGEMPTMPPLILPSQRAPPTHVSSSPHLPPMPLGPMQRPWRAGDPAWEPSRLPGSQLVRGDSRRAPP